MPTLLESGYEISSIHVDFDGGYLGSNYGLNNIDKGYCPVNPHTLNYDGDKLSIYSAPSMFFSRKAGETPLTAAQHKVVKEYWENLRALAEKEETEEAEEAKPSAGQQSVVSA